MDFKNFFNLPEVASSHGHEVDLVIYLVHILMLVLFVGWGIFFLFTLARFNRWIHPKANYRGVKSHVSTYLEVGVVALEALLLVGFSIPFWAKQINAMPERANNLEIRVIAEQFAWNIHYPGADGVFGKTSYDFFDKQSNPIGLDPNDEFGKDDIVTLNQMVIPVGRPILVRLSSKDVVHNFYLPQMRVKQDAIPGLEIPTWFTATKTGEWEIACAQLCGIGHYRMKGFYRAISEEDFETWMVENTPSLDGEDEFDDFWN